MSAKPSRGDIWQVDFGDPLGSEPGWERPAVVVSIDPFNHSRAGVVLVVPGTGEDHGIPLHVAVGPGRGGLDKPTWFQPENLVSISKQRLRYRRGRMADEDMGALEDRLRALLDLPYVV